MAEKWELKWGNNKSVFDGASGINLINEFAKEVIEKNLDWRTEEQSIYMPPWSAVENGTDNPVGQVKELANTEWSYFVVDWFNYANATGKDTSSWNSLKDEPISAHFNTFVREALKYAFKLAGRKSDNATVENFIDIHMSSGLAGNSEDSTVQFGDYTVEARGNNEVSNKVSPGLRFLVGIKTNILEGLPIDTHYFGGSPGTISYDTIDVGRSLKIKIGDIGEHFSNMATLLQFYDEQYLSGRQAYYVPADPLSLGDDDAKKIALPQDLLSKMAEQVIAFGSALEELADKSARTPIVSHRGRGFRANNTSLDINSIMNDPELADDPDYYQDSSTSMGISSANELTGEQITRIVDDRFGKDENILEVFFTKMGARIAFVSEHVPESSFKDPGPGTTNPAGKTTVRRLGKIRDTRILLQHLAPFRSDESVQNPRVVEFLYKVHDYSGTFSEAAFRQYLQTGKPEPLLKEIDFERFVKDYILGAEVYFRQYPDPKHHLAELARMEEEFGPAISDEDEARFEEKASDPNWLSKYEKYYSADAFANSYDSIMREVIGGPTPPRVRLGKHPHPLSDVYKKVLNRADVKVLAIKMIRCMAPDRWLELICRWVFENVPIESIIDNMVKSGMLDALLAADKEFQATMDTIQKARASQQADYDALQYEKGQYNEEILYLVAERDQVEGEILFLQTQAPTQAGTIGITLDTLDPNTDDIQNLLQRKEDLNAQIDDMLGRRQLVEMDEYSTKYNASLGARLPISHMDAQKAKEASREMARAITGLKDPNLKDKICKNILKFAVEAIEMLSSAEDTNKATDDATKKLKKGKPYRLEQPAWSELPADPILTYARELLNKLITEAISRTLLEVIKGLLKTIWKLCMMAQGNLRDDDPNRKGKLPGAGDFKDLLADDPTDSAALMCEVLDSYGFDIGICSVEELLKFLSDLELLLSETEVCALFRGNGAPMVTDIVRNLLKIRYPNIYAKLSPAGEQYAVHSAVNEFFKRFESLLEDGYCEDLTESIIEADQNFACCVPMPAQDCARDNLQEGWLSEEELSDCLDAAEEERYQNLAMALDLAAGKNPVNLPPVFCGEGVDGVLSHDVQPLGFVNDIISDLTFGPIESSWRADFHDFTSKYLKSAEPSYGRASFGENTTTKEFDALLGALSKTFMPELRRELEDFIPDVLDIKEYQSRGDAASSKQVFVGKGDNKRLAADLIPYQAFKKDKVSWSNGYSTKIIKQPFKVLTTAEKQAMGIKYVKVPQGGEWAQDPDTGEKLWYEKDGIKYDGEGNIIGFPDGGTIETFSNNTFKIKLAGGKGRLTYQISDKIMGENIILAEWGFGTNDKKSYSFFEKDGHAISLKFVEWEKGDDSFVPSVTANKFANLIFDGFAGTPNQGINSLANINLRQALDTSAIKKLFNSATISIIERFAFSIANSKFFDIHRDTYSRMFLSMVPQKVYPADATCDPANDASLIRVKAFKQYAKSREKDIACMGDKRWPSATKHYNNFGNDAPAMAVSTAEALVLTMLRLYSVEMVMRLFPMLFVTGVDSVSGDAVMQYIAEKIIADLAEVDKKETPRINSKLHDKKQTATNYEFYNSSRLGPTLIEEPPMPAVPSNAKVYTNAQGKKVAVPANYPNPDAKFLPKFPKHIVRYANQIMKNRAEKTDQGGGGLLSDGFKQYEPSDFEDLFGLSGIKFLIREQMTDTMKFFAEKINKFTKTNVQDIRKAWLKMMELKGIEISEEFNRVSTTQLPVDLMPRAFKSGESNYEIEGRYFKYKEYEYDDTVGLITTDNEGIHDPYDAAAKGTFVPTDFYDQMKGGGFILQPYIRAKIKTAVDSPAGLGFLTEEQKDDLRTKLKWRRVKYYLKNPELIDPEWRMPENWEKAPDVYKRSFLDYIGLCFPTANGDNTFPGKRAWAGWFSNTVSDSPGKWDKDKGGKVVLFPDVAGGYKGGHIAERLGLLEPEWTYNQPIKKGESFIGNKAEAIFMGFMYNNHLMKYLWAPNGYDPTIHGPKNGKGSEPKPPFGVPPLYDGDYRLKDLKWPPPGTPGWPDIRDWSDYNRREPEYGATVWAGINVNYRAEMVAMMEKLEDIVDIDVEQSLEAFEDFTFQINNKYGILSFEEGVYFNLQEWNELFGTDAFAVWLGLNDLDKAPYTNYFDEWSYGLRLTYVMPRDVADEFKDSSIYTKMNLIKDLNKLFGPDGKAADGYLDIMKNKKAYQVDEAVSPPAGTNWYTTDFNSPESIAEQLRENKIPHSYAHEYSSYEIPFVEVETPVAGGLVVDLDYFTTFNAWENFPHEKLYNKMIISSEFNELFFKNINNTPGVFNLMDISSLMAFYLLAATDEVPQFDNIFFDTKALLRKNFYTVLNAHKWDEDTNVAPSEVAAMTPSIFGGMPMSPAAMLAMTPIQIIKGVADLIDPNWKNWPWTPAGWIAYGFNKLNNNSWFAGEKDESLECPELEKTSPNELAEALKKIMTENGVLQSIQDKFFGTDEESAFFNENSPIMKVLHLILQGGYLLEGEFTTPGAEGKWQTDPETGAIISYTVNGIIEDGEGNVIGEAEPPAVKLANILEYLDEYVLAYEKMKDAYDDFAASLHPIIDKSLNIKYKAPMQGGVPPDFDEGWPLIPKEIMWGNKSPVTMEYGSLVSSDLLAKDAYLSYDARELILSEVIAHYATDLREDDGDKYFSADESIPPDATHENLVDLVPSQETWGSLPTQAFLDYIDEKLKAKGLQQITFLLKPLIQVPIKDYLYWDDASEFKTGGQTNDYNPNVAHAGFIIQAMTVWNNIKKGLLAENCGESLVEVIDSYEWCISKLKLQTATQYFNQVSGQINQILEDEFNITGDDQYDVSNEEMVAIANADPAAVKDVAKMVIAILPHYYAIKKQNDPGWIGKS